MASTGTVNATDDFHTTNVSLAYLQLALTEEDSTGTSRNEGWKLRGLSKPRSSWAELNIEDRNYVRDGSRPPNDKSKFANNAPSSNDMNEDQRPKLVESRKQLTLQILMPSQFLESALYVTILANNPVTALSDMQSTWWIEKTESMVIERRRMRSCVPDGEDNEYDEETHGDG
ncbi:hypothetical protein CRG98_043302 [Punica granatum]|uniref:Uncharacterized protein n=1 Tax=Punica granatum TaxID=22663 RepID=A0A2I0HYD1_PUNGR|nr:hypothetical protein CRG98_043302 [Punica granatum]